MTQHLRAVPILAFLAACILLGGASRAGFVANFVVQLAGIGFLAWGLYRIEWSSLRPFERWTLGLLAVGLVIVGLQFVPVGGDLWAQLPGRGPLAEEMAMLGVGPEPALLTLSLHESLRSAASLLPPIAVAIALMTMRKTPALGIAVTIVALAFAALLVGIIQFLGGQSSPLYFYDFTNRGYMVGFFANANHMATFLLISIPFIAAILKHGRERYPKRRLEFTILGATLMGFLAIGVALVGSMTGYLLALPVLFASALIIWPLRKGIAVAAAVPIVLLSGVSLALFGDTENIFSTEETQSLAGRDRIFETAAPAVYEFFPAGTGLGTFEEVYRRYEDESAVGSVFINHAHNDYVELVLELGLAGAVLIALFLVWWGVSFRRLLQMRASPFAWAGWIAIGVFLTHSAWDYPLRTAALATIFAICCIFVASLPQMEPSKRHG